MNFQIHCPTLEEFYASLEDIEHPVILLEGSRQVLQEHENALTQVGAFLAETMPHALFRSGNAEGSDSLFAAGVASVDPTRMQVVTPTPGHRKKNLHPDYDVTALNQVSSVHEEHLAVVSNAATPANQTLMENRNKIPRLGAKARYLLRDTLKVLGDPENKLAPANAALFYTKPDPMSAGTGHTIRVCQQHHVPYVLFNQWVSWLPKG
ncbi:hypothetical protein P3T73_04125 [Kiritimatiellota bacterium B12222]|nr:hypothetical protein P3T73_04125 [Kiritimatiellota bacterium B12222]